MSAFALAPEILGLLGQEQRQLPGKCLIWGRQQLGAYEGAEHGLIEIQLENGSKYKTVSVCACESVHLEASTHVDVRGGCRASEPGLVRAVLVCGGVGKHTHASICCEWCCVTVLVCVFMCWCQGDLSVRELAWVVCPM